jgi:hypothetical protein
VGLRSLAAIAAILISFSQHGSQQALTILFKQLCTKLAQNRIQA